MTRQNFQRRSHLRPSQCWRTGSAPMMVPSVSITTVASRWGATTLHIELAVKRVPFLSSG